MFKRRYFFKAIFLTINLLLPFGENHVLLTLKMRAGWAWVPAHNEHLFLNTTQVLCVFGWGGMPGRQQNKNHTGEERTEFKLGGRRKNLDFLQFEGAWPRNHKSEKQENTNIFFKWHLQSICHHNQPNIFMLNCFALPLFRELVFKMFVRE